MFAITSTLTASVPIRESATPLWSILSLVTLAGCWAISAILTPLIARFGHHLGVMDDPNLARKTHAAPTPRTGGIAIGVTFFVVLLSGVFVAPLLVQSLPILSEEQANRILPYLNNRDIFGGALAGILVGSFLALALGVADDRLTLGPRVKLFAQIALAALLWFTGTEARAFLPPPVAFVVTVGWVVLITNAFNLLDNMNGLSSGVAIIASLGFFVQAWFSDEWLMMLTWAALAGSIAGFWSWNFSRGTPFLGDGGSLFIGYLIAALALRSTYYKMGDPNTLPVLAPVVLLGIPLFDTLTVMLIRWREGRPLMVGDRCHLSHRLEALGMSQRDSVIFHYVICLALVFLATNLRQLPATGAATQLVAVALLFILLYIIERTAADQNRQ
jgi:UDP-GlcNAc:undecaprenyl-phosphate GlcNAc-1-phosphate transferase